LLHDADAVHDEVGAKLSQGAMEAVEIHDIHAPDHIVPLKQFDSIKRRVSHILPGGTDRTGKAFPKDLKHLVAEHSRSANDNDTHN
jgi:hypothetical protein